MIVACVMFLATGLTVSALGPSLPAFAGRTGSELAEVGALFTALFIGIVLGQAAFGPLNARLGRRVLVLAGLALFAGGVAGMLLSPSLPLLLGWAFVAGLGDGGVISGVNLLVAELFDSRGATALNLVNLFFGLGSVLGPALVSLSLREWGNPLVALWAGVAALLLLTPATLVIAVVQEQRHESRSGTSSAVLRSPLLWGLALLVLLYVGIEVGMGGWTARYLERTAAMDAATAALVVSGFWLAVTGGRMLGALLGLRMAARSLLLLSLVGTAVGGMLLVLGVGNTTLSVAAVLMLGLCFGPIYPTTFAIVTITFRQARATAASVVMVLASSGGALLPWLQGQLLERVSPLASVLLVAGAAVVMLGLHLMMKYEV